MWITSMDCDKTEIPATYDKARALSPETRRLWQDLLSTHIDRAGVSLIIDLGCGTGRFSELLAAHFGVRVIGVDPSLKMLDHARRKLTSENVVYCQGLAEALPIRDGCADLVFMSMVYHHFTDPSAVAEECRRVLRQGGYACIRNGTRESDFPHRHFFPLRALIDSDPPSRLDIQSVFAVSGFTPVVHRAVTQVTAPNWPSFVEKSALRADSFLARLSDDEFQQGMAALRNPGDAINRDDAVTEEIDWYCLPEMAEIASALPIIPLLPRTTVEPLHELIILSRLNYVGRHCAAPAAFRAIHSAFHCDTERFAPSPASIRVPISRADAQRPYGLLRSHRILSEPNRLCRLIGVRDISITAFRSPELSGAP
jgi:ubiquinone/menaquinone biosynthesis C-methylase UbiE